MDATLRAARAAALQCRHPPGRRRLRRPRVQPVGRARVHERARLRRPGRRPRPQRGPSPRTPDRDRRRPLRVQPGAPRRIRRRVRHGRRRRSHRRGRRGDRRVEARRARVREAVLRELATIPGVYVPSMYDVEYDGAFIASVHAALRRCPGAGRQAHGRRPGRLAVPEAATRPARRSRARPSERRDLPRLHARVPVLPGGHDHPPRPRAARRTGPHDGRRTACAAPATTRSRSRRCRAPTSPGSTASSPTSSPIRRAPAE